jgi:hypothetical protein
VYKVHIGKNKANSAELERMRSEHLRMNTAELKLP